ncbi:MAG: caspase family protein [Beijerinckiaceae bacterium]
MRHSFVGQLAIAGLVTIAFFGAGARPSQAEDLAAHCTANVYGRLQTPGERAAIISACTSLVEAPDEAADLKARALYFRGLNLFLAETMKKIGDAAYAINGDAALADLAAAIATDPAHAALAFELRGTIEAIVDREDAALADYTAAIAQDAKSSSARVGRALLLARRDRFDDAMADLDAAVAIDPHNQNAYVNRARLWERFGDYAKAIADYDAAEVLGGMQSWAALQARAALRLRTGDVQRAANDLEAATRGADATHQPHLIAQILLKRAELAREHQGDAAAAIALAGKAIELLPGSAEALIERGRAYEAAGNRAAALADYEKAVGHALVRSDSHAHAIYSWALFRLNLLQQGFDKRGDASEAPRARFVTLTPEIIQASKIPAAPKPESADKSRRIALVIGNSRYANVGSLPNAERDASTIAIALTGAGFESVTIGFDLDKSTFEKTLEDFGTRAAAADWAFVYYAGHGIEIADRNYLVPIDADLSTLRNANAHAVPLQTIVDRVKPAHALRIVMLDACRDNPFVQAAHRAQAENRSIELSADDLAAFHAIGGGLAPAKVQDAGTFIAFATRHGEAALDGDELDSPFAEAFVREVSAPGLEIRTLFEKIRSDVLSATQQQQHPTVYYKLPEESRFVFVAR